MPAGGLGFVHPASAEAGHEAGGSERASGVWQAASPSSALEAHSGYSTVAIAFVVLGFGMGLAMAPATDSIMGSLPLAQASVGSAINDTVRMVGGALGVAVLGSTLSSRYSSDMASAVRACRRPRRTPHGTVSVQRSMSQRSLGTLHLLARPRTRSSAG